MKEHGHPAVADGAFSLGAAKAELAGRNGVAVIDVGTKVHQDLFTIIPSAPLFLL